MLLVQKIETLQPMCTGKATISTLSLQDCTNVFQGNAELLSISSDDSIWNSEDEDGDNINDDIDRQSENGKSLDEFIPLHPWSMNDKITIKMLELKTSSFNFVFATGGLNFEQRNL